MMPRFTNRTVRKEIAEEFRCSIVAILYHQNISRAEVARELGVSRQRIYAVLSGRRPLNGPTLYAILFIMEDKIHGDFAHEELRRIKYMISKCNDIYERKEEQQCTGG